MALLGAWSFGVASCHAGPPRVHVTEIAVSKGTSAPLSQPPEQRSSTFDPASILAGLQQLDGAEREARCRELTQYTAAEYERCDVEPLGRGVLTMITIVTSCGGDSCDARGWLFSASLGEPVELHEAGGGVEAAPDGSFVVFDRIEVDAQNQWSVRLRRMDLASEEASPFANCFAPKLSPGGKYFVCRDRSANVLRVPTHGGVVEMVAESGASAAAIEWLPYAYSYPSAVDFPTPGEVTFRIQYADGAIAQHSAEWGE